MKKIFLAITMLFPMLCQAQILDMSKYLQPLTMSARFARRLEKCLPFVETKSFNYLGVEGTTTYRIYGKTAGKECEFEVTSETNLGISASQICYFPQEELEQFLEHVRQLIQRSKISIENAEDFLSDPDYKSASSLMENKKYCDFYRDRIDFTKQIRDNLMDCNSAWETQKFNGISISRKIIGRNGSTCQYEEVISFNRSDMNKLANSWIEIFKDELDYEEEQTFLFTCHFDEEDLGELHEIYASMIIPEGKTFDNLNYIPSKEILNAEPDFITDRCELEKL